MTKHTPGPWLRKDTIVYALEHHRWRKGVEEFRNRFSAQIVRGPDMPDDEAEANARLLAAAPDLLEAMEAAVVGLTQGACFTCGAEPGVNIDCPGCAWVSRAEAILAKARGP